MIAVLPEGTSANLAIVVLLGCSSRNELHASPDFTVAAIDHQKMNMIGRHNEIEHYQPESSTGFKQPVHSPVAVFGKFEQPLLFMAAMRDVPDLTRHDVAIGARHNSPPWVKRRFLP